MMRVALRACALPGLLALLLLAAAPSPDGSPSQDGTGGPHADIAGALAPAAAPAGAPASQHEAGSLAAEGAPSPVALQSPVAPPLPPVEVPAGGVTPALPDLASPAVPGLPYVGVPPLPSLPADRQASPSWQPSPEAAAAAAAAGAGTVAAAGAVGPWRRAVVGVGRRAWALLGAGAAGLFSRIQGDDVLDHATRSGILGIVAASPGISLHDLQQRLGVAWGTLVHHVRVLERHGQLASARQGPRRLLFVANTPEARLRDDLALLHVPTAQRIALAVEESPGIHQGALCAHLGLRAPAASKHLARFEDAGLVEVTREAGRCRYGATDRLRQALRLALPAGPAACAGPGDPVASPPPVAAAAQHAPVAVAA